MSIYLSELQKSFIGFLPHLLVAVLILAVGYWLARFVATLVRNLLERRKSDRGATGLLTEITRWGIFTYAAILALQQFMDITAFLAGLGILGFTVGFALQDVMKNFAAGVLLLVQHPFVVGESISVAGYDGEALSIDLRSTQIKTFDGRLVTLPNAQILDNPIINYTRSTLRRIELPVGVGYGSDLAVIRELILHVLEPIPGYQATPAPIIVFNAFGESSIDMMVYFWIDTNQIGFLDAQDTAIKGIKQAFDHNGIDIPFPTRTVLTPTKA